MSQRPRVLVVDDEENITFLVASALRLEGMEVATAGTARDAFDQIGSWRPDGVVLDVMLPDYDGFTLLQRIRDTGNDVPVLFLTARDTPQDRVRGLEDGGDDYLVKPFDVAELVARVRLRLRRHGTASGGRRLRCADLEMDTERHDVLRAGEPVHLSPTEFRLLKYLLVNSGRVLTREQILEHVWTYEFEGEISVVDTYVSYLRRKLDHVSPKLIHTVRGIGFTLRAEP